MIYKALALAIVLVSAVSLAADPVKLVQGGKSDATIAFLAKETMTDADKAILADAAEWLIDVVEKCSGARMKRVDAATDATVVIGLAEDHPDVTAKVKLKSDHFDAYAIVSSAGRLFLLGNTPDSARHAVAHVLRHLGVRYYAPSARWHIFPAQPDITIDLNLADQPDIGSRRIWYAYGHGESDIKSLLDDHKRWVIANRLSERSLIACGHSYGHIIERNKQAFAEHPEYSAMDESGKRTNDRKAAAQKLCYSNPGLIDLVAADRIKLLEEYRQANPRATMVSMDPSDGEGTCHCENCKALGTTSDRVFHLANEVLKRVRKKYPEAWVGLYGYSSHRLPPTIELDDHIYVQVAMGFNKTQYTLAELVELWSKKVGEIGLREYYGVEAWDWGLPGRLRGGNVAYHRKWIPFYAARKTNAINAETNSNWGGQMLGLYVAAQLMWDVDGNVDGWVSEYFRDCFGPAADAMRSLQERFDATVPLYPATVKPMFEDLARAWQAASDPAIKARLVDLMAYLVYVDEYRRFDLAAAADSGRGNAYYAALRPLMNYTWRIRHRDIAHYFALARRLCNGLPRSDNRLDFFMYNKDQAPVWKEGEPYSDEEVIALFQKTLEQLRSDKDPTVVFSRDLVAVAAPGADAGPTRILREETEGLTRFRRKTSGYLVPSGPMTVNLAIQSEGREAKLTVYREADDDPLFEQAIAKSDQLEKVQFQLERAGQYRFVLSGDVRLQVGPEVPMAIEASMLDPVQIEYSGPHYFYVPRGVKQLAVDGSPRLALEVPGQNRTEISDKTRVEGQRYTMFAVPGGTDGQVWHTHALTRGRLVFFNIPPLLSLHRNQVFVPREVAEKDRLKPVK